MKPTSALFDLKKFNYEKIYKSEELKVNHHKVKRGFSILFDHYLSDYKSQNKNSEIFIHFLDSKDPVYIENNSDELIVRDFIAGMTDRYFSSVLKKLILPDVANFQF